MPSRCRPRAAPSPAPTRSSRSRRSARVWGAGGGGPRPSWRGSYAHRRDPSSRAVHCRDAEPGSARTLSLRAGSAPSGEAHSPEHSGVRAGSRVCARIGDRDSHRSVRGSRPREDGRAGLTELGSEDQGPRARQGARAHQQGMPRSLPGIGHRGQDALLGHRGSAGRSRPSSRPARRPGARAATRGTQPQDRLRRSRRDSRRRQGSSQEGRRQEGPSQEGTSQEGGWHQEGRASGVGTRHGGGSRDDGACGAARARCSRRGRAPCATPTRRRPRRTPGRCRRRCDTRRTAGSRHAGATHSAAGTPAARGHSPGAAGAAGSARHVVRERAPDAPARSRRCPRRTPTAGRCRRCARPGGGPPAPHGPGARSSVRPGAERSCRCAGARPPRARGAPTPRVAVRQAHPAAPRPAGVVVGQADPAASWAGRPRSYHPPEGTRPRRGRPAWPRPTGCRHRHPRRRGRRPSLRWRSR